MGHRRDHLPDQILRRRAEVELWVAHQLAAEGRLFSRTLAPPCGTAYDVLSEALNRPLLHGGPAKRLREDVAYVVERRRAALSIHETTGVIEPKGRWLLFLPDAADFCAIAHDPGFVDEADAPAWDLWVCWCREARPMARPDEIPATVLVSWVPEGLAARYDHATKCSPCSTVVWADHGDITEFRGHDYFARLVRDWFVC